MPQPRSQETPRDRAKITVVITAAREDGSSFSDNVLVNFMVANSELLRGEAPGLIEESEMVFDRLAERTLREAGAKLSEVIGEHVSVLCEDREDRERAG